MAFLDAAPPNQLLGLNERTYRQHLAAALEAVLNVISSEEEEIVPWQELYRIQSFEIKWSRPNPFLFTTFIYFSLNELDVNGASIGMSILGHDQKLSVGNAMCEIQFHVDDGDKGEGRIPAATSLRKHFGI
ncbi:hypothetical protein [Roseibium sp. SCP14]|uniref:hypothetical protein n=1 Tax=Roseibium sp. SCP14 TaxID=3141375 RepID=UPI00333672DE